jgi:hypothetical protein
MSLTFVQYIRNQLNENGLFPEMIDTLIPLIVSDEFFQSTMTGRWNDQVDGYPPMVAHFTYIGVVPIVYKWISENHPHAWFRPLFAPGVNSAEDSEAFVTKFWEENKPAEPDTSKTA